MPAGLLEPADHLDAFAGLGGDEDGAAVERQRGGELFGDGQRHGVDAEGAIIGFDGASDGVRTAHAEHEQATGLLERSSGAGGDFAVGLEGGEGVGVLAGHFAIDGEQTFGARSGHSVVLSISL